MRRLLGSELFKLRTTRTFYGVCLGVLLLVAIIVGLTSSLADFDEDSPMDDMLGVATLVQPFALILGVLAVATEFRHGTITPSLLAVPDRLRLVIAKLGANVLAGLALGVLGFAVAAAIAGIAFSTRDIDSGVDTAELLEMTAGGAIGAALYAGIGVGLGALMANQVGAIVSALAWIFVLEGLIGAIPGADFMTTYGVNGLSTAVSGTDTGLDEDDLLDAVPAGLVLAGYALVFALAGAGMLRRRDVDA